MHAGKGLEAFVKESRRALPNKLISAIAVQFQRTNHVGRNEFFLNDRESRLKLPTQPLNFFTKPQIREQKHTALTKHAGHLVDEVFERRIAMRRVDVQSDIEDLGWKRKMIGFRA